MDNEIYNTIDKLAEKFGIAVNWGNKNVVPYIQDLITRYSKFEIASSAIWSIICFVLVILCIIGIVRSIRNIKRGTPCDKNMYDAENEEAINIAIMVISISGLLAFAILACCFTDMLIKWIFIPDVSFMKTILDMIK